MSPLANRDTTLLAESSPTKESSLEAVELLNVQQEHNGAADRNLDRAGDKSAGRRRFIRHDVHQLFPALAVLLENLSQHSDFGLFGSDQDGRIPFPKKSTRRADYRELEACLHQLVSDAPLVAVMQDAHGQLHA
jgi:hypothetical protein